MIIGGMSCLMKSVWFSGHLGVYRSYKLRERERELSFRRIFGAKSTWKAST